MGERAARRKRGGQSPGAWGGPGGRVVISNMKREGNSPRRAIELQCLHKTAAGERRPTPKAWCLPVKKGRGVTLRRAPAVKNNETKKIEHEQHPCYY